MTLKVKIAYLTETQWCVKLKIALCGGFLDADSPESGSRNITIKTALPISQTKRVEQIFLELF